MRGRIIIPLLLFFSLGAYTSQGQEIDAQIKEFYLMAFGQRNDDLDSAFSCIRKALSLTHKTNNKEAISATYSVTGVLYKNRGDFAEALKYQLEGLRLREQLGNEMLISNSCSNIGALYYLRENLKEALFYYKRCARLREKNRVLDKLTPIYTDMGNVFSERYTKDNSYQDSAIWAYQKALQHADTSEVSRTNANLYLNLGILHRDRGEVIASRRYLEKTLTQQKELKDYRGQANTYHNLGLLDEEAGDYQQARRRYYKALKLSYKSDYPVKRLDIVQNLMLHYAITGNADSTKKYFNHFKFLNDTLNKAKTDKQIAKLEIKYKTAEKERANQLLVSQNKILNREKEVLYISLIGTVLLVLGVTALFLLYRQKQITRKLEDQNRINTMIREQDKKYFTAILEGQEQERKRISKELHDRMGGLLSTVKLHFDNLKKQPEPDPETYKTTEGLLNKAIEEIRKISNNMISGVLLNFGLVAAFRDLADTVSSTGKLNVKVISFGVDKRLDNRIEINLFRVVQETVANTLRHSGATQMDIRLNRDKKELKLIITDNGSGFNWESRKEGHGLGLKSIESRVQTLDGDLQVDTAPSKGTQYTIIIQLKENDQSIVG